MEKNEQLNGPSLELGQIIQINASSNSDIHNKMFKIYYLDYNVVKLITQTLEKQEIILKNGIPIDETIESINILYTPVEKGYARQNNLNIDKWISIKFGGEIPMIINGKITNLEEDRIEITSIPDNEIFYIDFEYKGIPLDLPIQDIDEYKPPKSVQIKSVSSNEIKEDEDISIEDELDMDEIDDEELDGFDDEKFVEDQPTNNLQEIIIEADKLVFGESAGIISEIVEVSEEERIYSVDEQTNDLLDDLLSTIPSSERTASVINNINIMVERFKELRLKYSKFDENGILSNINYKTNNYKPLLESLKQNNNNLKWIIPVSNPVKKIFDINEENIESLELNNSYDYLNNIISLYDEGYSNNISIEHNKYEYINRNVDLTSKKIPLNKNKLLIVSPVKTNMLSIVDNSDDNNDDFYSYSIKYDGLEKHRFNFEKYTIGLDSLHVDPYDKNKIPFRKTMVSPQEIPIKGFLTLPYHIYRFSNINLPTTNIYDKTNLNNINFNYLSYLNNKTDVNIVSLNDESKYDVNNFNLSKINYYVYDSDIKYEDRNIETNYKTFLDNMIPSNKDAFEHIKKYIKNGVSYDKILEYLHPLLINNDDIVFKDYLRIVEFVSNEIEKYKKQLVQYTFDYNKYLKNRKTYDDKSILFNIFEEVNSNELKNIDMKIYNLNNENSIQYLSKIYKLDDGNVFMDAMALNSIELNQPINLKDKLEKTLNEIKQENQEESDKNEKQCGVSFTLAKKYYDIDVLVKDNDKNIFFDSKLDDTRYDIMDELKSQYGESLNKTIIIEHLIKNAGLDENKANKEADAMINKKRTVSENDYALLDDGTFELKYYIRKSNKWVHKKEFDNKSLDDIEFCNTKKHCLKINTECSNEGINKKLLQEKLVNNILENFENELEEDIIKTKTRVQKSLKYNIENFQLLKKHKNKNNIKYDNAKYKLGEQLDILDIPSSPYEKIKNIILGIDDIVSRMNNILKFINKYCRKSINDDESEWWYYCIDTNVPLLPTFYYNLAVSIKKNNYLEELDRVSNERGILSDDGDKIVDKHSGYFIKMIDFDSTEGYDESGFKMVSRDLLEEEQKELPETKEEKQKTSTIIGKTSTFKVPTSELGKQLYKILMSLDGHFKINTTNQYHFMIKMIKKFLKKYVNKRSVYEKNKEAKIKQGKRVKSYEKYRDEQKIKLILCLYVIGIQINVPHINHAPTFVGCGPLSFEGFPLEEGTNYSILRYVSCVFLNLKSSVEPWNALPKTSSRNIGDVTNKMVDKFSKYMIDKILTNDEIRNELKNKRKWLKNNRVVDYTNKTSTKNVWETFLPPLKPVNVQHTSNIGDSFKNMLRDSMIKNTNDQFSYIFSLYAKIINQSLLVNEDIQSVINNKPLLLNTMNNIPYLENACCLDINNSFEYFSSKSPGIVNHNNNVIKLTKIKNNYEKLHKAPFLRNTTNTKLKIPELNPMYSEDTIYLSFIKYCSYNTGLILEDDYSLLCSNNNSSYSNTDDIFTKIDIMKGEGNNYSNDSLLKLIKLVSSKNIVLNNLKKDIVDDKLVFEKRLEYVSDNKKDFLNKQHKSFKLIKNIINFKKGENNNMEDLLINIKNETKTMLLEISDLLKQTGKTKKQIDFLKDIHKFEKRGDNKIIDKNDETNLFASDYLSDSARHIGIIFPYMIKNKRNTEEIKIPKHWNLHENHVKDLQNILFKELGSLNKFYDDEDIINVLDNVLLINKDIFMLMERIPFILNIKREDKFIDNNLNGKSLNVISKYLWTLVMYVYVYVIEKIDLESVDLETVSKDVEMSIMLGRKQNIKNKIGNLLINYINIIMKQKEFINYSMDDINSDFLKTTEKEKDGIRENLKRMNKESRKVEMLLREHGLGDYSAYKTKALFQYMGDHYDKERTEAQDRLIKRKKAGISDKMDQELADTLLEDYEMNEEIEMREAPQVNGREIINSNLLGEDDDMGELDGDEMFL